MKRFTRTASACAMLLLVRSTLGQSQAPDYRLVFDLETGVVRLYPMGSSTPLGGHPVIPAGRTIRAEVINLNPFRHSVSGKHELKALSFSVPDEFKKLADASITTTAQNTETPKVDQKQTAIDRAAGLAEKSGKLTTPTALPQRNTTAFIDTMAHLQRKLADGDKVLAKDYLDLAARVNPPDGSITRLEIEAAVDAMLIRRKMAREGRKQLVEAVTGAIGDAKAAIKAYKAATRLVADSADLFTHVKKASRNPDHHPGAPSPGFESISASSNSLIADMWADSRAAVIAFGCGGTSPAPSEIETRMRIIEKGIKESSDAMLSAIQKAHTKAQDLIDASAMEGIKSRGKLEVADENRSEHIKAGSGSAADLLRLSLDSEFYAVEVIDWEDLGSQTKDLLAYVTKLEVESKKLVDATNDAMPKAKEAASNAQALYAQILATSFTEIVPPNPVTKEGVGTYKFIVQDIAEDGKVTDSDRTPEPFLYEVSDARSRRPVFGAGYVWVHNLGQFREYTAVQSGQNLVIAERPRETLSNGVAAFVHFPINPLRRGDVNAISFGYGADTFMFGGSRLFGSSFGGVVTIGLGLKNFTKLSGTSVGGTVSSADAIPTKKVLGGALFLSIQFRF